MQKNHALWIFVFALSLFSVGCESYVVNVDEGEDAMNDGSPRKDPIIVDSPLPKVNSGTTEYFTDSTERSIGRVSFDRPRGLVAYAFWDPYKNNPNATGVAINVNGFAVVYDLGI